MCNRALSAIFVFQTLFLNRNLYYRLHENWVRITEMGFSAVKKVVLFLDILRIVDGSEFSLIHRLQNLATRKARSA